MFFLVAGSGTVWDHWNVLGCKPQDDIHTPAFAMVGAAFPWACWDGDAPRKAQEAAHHGPSQYLILRPPVSPGDLWHLTSSQLPARPQFVALRPGRFLLPHPIAACSSAFLECVCISDICIFEAFKNSIFVMKANEELILKKEKKNIAKAARVCGDVWFLKSGLWGGTY